jgi:PAS domain S-box-containing protein
MDLEPIFRSALDALPQAICICDPTGRLLLMNSSAQKLTGGLGACQPECSLTAPGGAQGVKLGAGEPKLCDPKLCEIDFSKNQGQIEICGRTFEYSLSPLQDISPSGCFMMILESLPPREAEENHPPPFPEPGKEARISLRRDDRILAGAALATNQLLITEQMDLALSQALEILGCSADVDRVYIFENYDTKNGEHRCKLSHDWTGEDFRPEDGRLPPHDLSYSEPIPWYESLALGTPLRGLAKDLPGQARLLLERLNVRSFLIVPIFTKGGFWGFIGFDDRRNERIWTWGEVSVLMTIAGAIGGSIDRYKTQAALQDSERKYRELVEGANSIIMRRDMNGNITFINKFAQDFFGYGQEEILGRNVIGTIVPPVDSEGRDLKEMIRRIGENPLEYATNVNENMRSDGKRVWIAWTNRPVRDESGKITEILCIGSDLTENRLSSERLKKAVQDLRMARDYLENLFGHANAPIIVWDPSFRITRFNRAFERLTGHLAGDVLGKQLDILFPEESRAVSLAYIKKTLSGERWDTVEIPILRRDREVRTVLWNSANIYDEDGKNVVATIAQGQDITERKEAESQVIFQASLLNQVRNAVIATDLQGRILYWNHFSEVLYGWKADEVLGRSIAETIVPEGKGGLVKGVIEEIMRCGYGESELLVRRKDESLFPAFYAFSVLKDRQGRSTGFVGVSIDLTERKKVEQDLLLAKEHAESATKAKSEFLANMSHEIRTPMNAVIGLTGLLLNTNIDSEQRDYIETIRSSGDSLLAVISDILDFSKIEGGMLDLEMEPFDLPKCLQASVNMVAQAAARKGLLLGIKIEPDVPRHITGDTVRLKQVLVNLLGNAVKFTEAGEISIGVSCRARDGRYEIRFAVKDTGIGISQDLMGRLFQSFCQVDASTTRKYGGTGLGLAISKNLVELMGGRIWAESEPGKGSVFYFTIQAEAMLPIGSAKPEKEPDPTACGVPRPQNKDLWILLAEDNAVNQKVAMRILERLGYRADIAANGIQVLGALKSRPYDVVLMDVQMPEMDGLEATRRIRIMPGRQPYIIAMTAHAMKGDREECLAAGMNDYVSKPVRIEELHAAILRCHPIFRKEN